uniref:Uncharacterized protein n=1 Tax=Siphoviridae sp. ctoRD1 TaxID=2825669 RepID=A0A8S5QEK2_9CAUD|nr:MAG TPA: hypothetical protein [Siphoviridae sp. ctoRD1]
MRIRFVTKAQLQVLQASKAEKHLMPDGPIPLFGSLPSAVSRQWGVNVHGIITLPVSCQLINIIVPAHSGINFIDAKVRETNPLIKFTLDVGQNTGKYEDAQWIAVGK